MTHIDKFHAFKTPIDTISLPERFTFPFYYQPHPLSDIAAKELQAYLETQQDFQHNFGLPDYTEGMIIGKMFGVLVVQKADGTLGYIAAFSGKLADENHHNYFVPPVYDMLTEGSFFLTGIKDLNAVNAQVTELEQEEHYLQLIQEYQQLSAQVQQEIAEKKAWLKAEKAKRKALRNEAAQSMNATELTIYEAYLVKESLHQKHIFNEFSKDKNASLFHLKNTIDAHEQKIESLKEYRKTTSAALQDQLFESYSFLNANGNSKSLKAIFKDTTAEVPPAGAGECAAPKLLQYAYTHQLKPICMAEFWWGQSPVSEIRKHKDYYPACMGKCGPILGHMLEGLAVDENPMLSSTSAAQMDIEILFEDDYYVVINKPHNFLSVPGINVKDSVYSWMRFKYPDATGPLIIHRLDMATSGILILAKEKEASVKMQAQFIRRTIHKRYEAILDGEVQEDEGTIDFPLCVNIDDRPRQMVHFEYGKKAVTRWKKIAVKDGKTLIHFWPLTGRTHQLRMHAAHELGLGCPIKGDDLYGTSSDRLYLHAAALKFSHPYTKEEITITCNSNFTID